VKYEEALYNLGLLERPKVTLADVKAEYRRQAFLHHPDRGGDAEKFKELKASYELVLEFRHQLTQEEDILDIEYTADGYPVSDLGLGLGSDVMGAKPCEDCRGKGHVVRFRGRREPVSIPCPRCEGNGVLYYRCKKCRGYGKIMGKTCPECEGAGRLIDRACNYCHSSGRVFRKGQWVETTVRVVYRCSTCEGTGEIELFNPVIPRNVVVR